MKTPRPQTVDLAESMHEVQPIVADANEIDVARRMFARPADELEVRIRLRGPALRLAIVGLLGVLVPVLLRALGK